MIMDGWTHEEVEQLKLRLEAEIEEIEDEYPNAKEFPPLSYEEARDALLALVGVSASRQLSRDEVFMAGQLVSCFEIAVRAQTLGMDGRYLVIHEDDIVAMMNG